MKTDPVKAQAQLFFTWDYDNILYRISQMYKTGQELTFKCQVLKRNFPLYHLLEI